MVEPMTLAFGAQALTSALGGIFGRQKKTGFGEKFYQSLDYLRHGQERNLQNFQQLSGGFMDQIRALSPTFSALEQRSLADLNDGARTARLEAGFQERLRTAQASRGTFRSPSAGLQESFAGLQFQEQQRQQAYNNALQFQLGAAQPFQQALFGALGGVPTQGDLGLQQFAFQNNTSAANNQSFFGGLNAGIGDLTTGLMFQKIFGSGNSNSTASPGALAGALFGAGAGQS